MSADHHGHRHAAHPATRRGRMLRLIGADELGVLSRSTSGRALLACVSAIAVATLIGLAALWSSDPSGPTARPQAVNISATVTAVSDAACPGTEGLGDDAPAQRCRTITVDPEGELAPAPIMIGPTEGSPRLAAGDAVTIAEVERPEGTPDEIELDPYAYVGIDRSSRLGWAAALLCVLALIALRSRGILAIAGVVASLGLLVEFLVPAVLAGHSPVLVALVSSLAVMFVTLTFTNGFGAQTMASALGIALTLLLATGAGLLALNALNLDGTGSDVSTLLAQSRPGLSLQGVLRPAW